MRKNYAVSDFVTLSANKKKTADCTFEQQANICAWLLGLGFGQTLLDGKRITYRRIEGTVKPGSILIMKDMLRKFFETHEFDGWPDGVGRNDLLEWYYKALPPKQNDIFRTGMERELSDDELHQYLLHTDFSYRDRFRISQVIDRLAELGFEKSEDVTNSIFTRSDLYYKQTGAGQYLVFSHFNKYDAYFPEGVDCYLAPFGSIMQHKQVPEPTLKVIRNSFQIDRDFSLIENYLS